MTPTTRASRAAVLCAAVLAGVHLLGAALATGDPAESGTSLLLGSVLLAAAVGMARGNRFGARLTAVVVCVLDLVAVALVVTVGPPGEGREPFDLSHAAITILAATIVALVVVDGRLRARSREPDPAPPYAL
ncbi:hypothetical protein D0Z08_14340 [Nocardioides immobilis]|uniref:Histidine kinase n=1 Tax=Nocardioides immobilis TaxID=2049295 RepID=A0A417Y1H6_9ACTN|nr:hypothetical protein [Nocardioides immobilis]RHW26502.1 hypothetical protein D0Z08_14340 [Nocardioides immobilis]